MAGKRKSKRTKEQEELVKRATAAAAPVILKSIGRRLTERHPNQWVPVKDLIKLDRGVSQSVWKCLRNIRTTGTELHSCLEADHRLLRHKFANGWIVLGRPSLRNIEEPRTEEARRNRTIPLPRPIDTSTLDNFDETKRLVEQDARSVIDAINTAKTATDPADEETTSASAASTSATAETTPTRPTRLRARIASSTKKMLQADTPADVKEAYDQVPPELQQNVLFEVTTMAKKAQEYSDKLEKMMDNASAHDVLSMFDSDWICNRHFLEKLRGSKGYEDSVSPRVNFSELNDRSKKDVSNLLGAIAMRVIEILLPQADGDGYGEILDAVMKSKPFRLHAMPDVTCDSRGYEEWRKSPMVVAIKSTFDKLGRYGKQTRVQLLPIFIGYYPIYWPKDAFDVGDSLIRQAKSHALDDERGPGNSDKYFLKDTRNKRVGAKETCFQDWLHDPTNVKTSPEISKDGSGNYIEKEVRYKALRTGPAYERYRVNLEKEKRPFYSRAHFYQRVKEEQLRDTTKDNGLCPSCTKYGAQTWEVLRSVAKMIYSPGDGDKRNSAIKEIGEYEDYFVRGGKFYNSLEQESECIHHCVVYALSDPSDDNFYQDCDHEHPIGDATVEACDKLFRTLFEDAVSLLLTKNYTAAIDDAEWRARGVRGGKVVLSKDGEDDRKLPWSDLTSKGLSLSDINYLAMPEEILRLQKNHLNLRRHLYLDRNQMYGEMMVNSSSRYRFESDYCMKLRAAIWKTGSNDFHLLMNKGTSVHTSALSVTLSEDAVDAEAGDAEAGDEKVMHIDTFGSNTGQGGYETLCVLEATLKKALQLQPSLGDSDGAVLIQDAGSGYKSTTVVAALRKSKEVTGVRVKMLIFNASGEGKRYKTDGHFPVIKAIRRTAMMAGEPAECTTPRREVMAQQYNGGIDGAHPFLLEFNYDNEVAVSALSSISQYHVFEYLDDGGIRMWKTYGVGPGKVMSSDEIDQLYADAAEKEAKKKRKKQAAEEAASSSEEEDAKSDDEIDGGTWHRYALRYRDRRVAKKWKGRICLGTCIESGGDEDDDRAVRVEFDDEDVVEYIEGGYGRDENVKIATGELDQMIRLYEKEGVELDGTKPSADSTAREPRSTSRAKAQRQSSRGSSRSRRKRNNDVDEAPIVVQESTGTSLAVVEPSSVAAEKVMHRVQPSYRKRRARIKATTERKRKREDDLPERKRKKILQDRKVKTKEVVVKPMEEAATYPLAEGYTRSFGSLMMGHGLKNFRDSNEVDSVAAGILEEQFQCGVAKESNRKGVLEMEEECARQMPSLLVPPRTTIAAWLQTRLNNAKSTKEKQGDSNEKRKYTQDESKQQKAAVVSKKEKEKLGTDDKRSRDLWLSKYKGILLEYSSDGGDGSDVIEEEIRIVASVRFNNNTKRWEAETDHASEIEDLQRAVSSAVPAGTDDIIYIPIGSLKSKGEIGPFIKAYNERLFATDGD